MACRSIGVLLEGDGDYDAVPLLLRNIMASKQYFDMKLGMKPIIIGDYISMMKAEKFIRLFTYAIFRNDIDAVIIALDCEDHCALEVVQAVYERINDIAARANKPVGIVLFTREYEAMFLANLNHIAENSKSIEINPGAFDAALNPLALRDAKGHFAATVVGSTYKESRDQVRVTAAMDVAHCAANYRPLQHLINLVDWAYTWDGTRHLY